MVQLQNEAQKQQFSSSAWIGLYNDINSWRWSFANEPLGTLRPWQSGQPNNLLGNQECVATYTDGWNDMNCSNIYYFMCFDDIKIGNQRYIFNSTRTTWLQAQHYCRQYHTDLVSIKDATELSVILGMVSDWTWIGLFRDSWKWTDQTNFSTIFWMSGKPDNALSNENCGYLNNTKAGDARCSDIMPFFCYSVITGKWEIIKVTVQSFYNVNDPEVKVAILEQIKQKLKDHGLAENITVKWREQPNGVVFHKKKGNYFT
ncbi:C-type mannose receptor 2-like [Silurus meridionalis]|nr:C-type mannose receptor 2-like [Silurus meridionalis]